MKFHSTKILVLIIICNLMAISGYYFLFQQIKTESTAALYLSNTIDSSQQKDSRLNLLRSTVKDTEGKRQQLAAFLLPSDMEVSFIEEVETLAKSSGLSEKTDNVSSVAGIASSTKVFQMQMETTGNWGNTMYFLDQIENLPYDIRVLNFSVSRQSGLNKVLIGKSTSLPWTATFGINVTESI